MAWEAADGSEGDEFERALIEGEAVGISTGAEGIALDVAASMLLGAREGGFTCAACL